MSWLKDSLDWVQRVVALFELWKTLLALGLGAVVRTFLATKIPSLWLTPVWLISSAVILWLLSKWHTADTNRGDTDTLAAFRNPHWETISRRQFMNEDIDIDGKRFFDCSFHNVSLLFHGKAPTEFIRSSITGDLRLITDSPPAMEYSNLVQMFSKLPGISKFVSTDEKGNVLNPSFEVKESPTTTGDSDNR